jgi:hypothetical protein
MYVIGLGIIYLLLLKEFRSRLLFSCTKVLWGFPLSQVYMTKNLSGFQFSCGVAFVFVGVLPYNASLRALAVIWVNYETFGILLGN